MIFLKKIKRNPPSWWGGHRCCHWPMLLLWCGSGGGSGGLNLDEMLSHVTVTHVSLFGHITGLEGTVGEEIWKDKRGHLPSTAPFQLRDTAAHLTHYHCWHWVVFPPEKPISRHVLWFLKGFSHGNTKGVSERKIWETHYVFLSCFP